MNLKDENKLKELILKELINKGHKMPYTTRNKIWEEYKSFETNSAKSLYESVELSEWSPEMEMTTTIMPIIKKYL